MFHLDCPDGKDLQEERLHLIALNIDRKAGPRGAASYLYRKYGERRRNLFQAAPVALAEVEPSVARLLKEERGAPVQLPISARREAEAEVDRAAAAGVSIVTWFDDEYPYNLRLAEQPPPVLYVKGTLHQSDRAAVAVVGSRRAGADYVRFAGDLSSCLAQSGITVVSGLARGVDRAAHEGAIVAASGRTLAVLGSGIDVVYPPEHGALADEVARHGALISYYPMGTAPLPHHFPARNWVIASLALGVVVVQSARKSGALITANYAGALGREVMAVPGHVENRMSDGAHGLIKDGARLVTSADDVLDCIEFALRYHGLDLARMTENDKEGRNGSITEQIAGQLESGPSDADGLAVALNAAVAEVQQALVRMEIDGRLHALGDGRYRLKG